MAVPDLNFTDHLPSNASALETLQQTLKAPAGLAESIQVKVLTMERLAQELELHLAGTLVKF